MLPRVGHTKSKIIFDKKLVNIDAGVEVLYRGFDDIVPMIYAMPVILGGIFGRHYPDEVSIWEVRNHKITNLSSEYYFAAMTTSLDVARARGQGDYLQIDPALFRGRIIDVNKSFSRRSFTMPSMMSAEAEQIAVAIPYCAIKSLCIQGDLLPNPFYVADADARAQTEYAAIYEIYLNLLHDKFNHALSSSEEEQSTREYVRKYLDFYADFGGKNNPFDMTIDELAAKHPQFAGQMQRQCSFTSGPSLFQQRKTLADLALHIADKVLSLHPYCQNIPATKPECTTVYDDEYARPQYE
jgi:hypothetical protein